MKKIKALYVEYKDFIMEVIHFGMVGVINTLAGWAITAVLYNIVHLSYWVSSAISYFIGSVFSYFANSKVTFKVENKDKWLPLRFAINIIVCYLIAYSVAQPLVRMVLSGYSTVVIDNVAIILATGMFIVMNFFGQKFFVFRTKNKKNRICEESK